MNCERIDKDPFGVRKRNSVLFEVASSLVGVEVNHSALTGHTACNEDGACIQAPPQFRIPLQACGFGFIARCFRGG